MNRFKPILILILAFLFVVPCEDALSQRRKRRSSKRSPVRSYVDIYGGAGYSLMMHNIAGSKTPGGGAGMIGVGYDLKHRRNPLIFHAGLEFMLLNSTTKMDPFRLEGQFNYGDPTITGNYPMDFYMDFNPYKESHNRFSINVPILVGAEFDRWYIMGGAKAQIGVLGFYNTRGTVTTSAKDHQLIGDFENMPTHAFEASDFKSNGNINFGIDVTASVEGGVVLDEWMPRNMLKLNNKNRTKLSYRAGLFADYGILNINANRTEGSILRFPNYDNVEGGTPIPANEIKNVSPKSLLASDKAANTKLNSLVVGAKFTVLFQVSKEPVKRKRPKPKPKPRPKPQVPLPDPPFFYVLVRDFDTEKPIDADVKLYRNIAPFDTVFVSRTDTETGMAQTRVKSSPMGLRVSRSGYIEYVDSLPGIYNDTIYVDLQPIKENTIVILENLLFDFDKATIKNDSTTSVLELEKLMKENPNVIIEITGHTDNVGRESYNKKLSERRAKAVYDLMIQRGIPADRMTYKGMGSRDPIDTNETDEGRAANRRVEFMIIYADDNGSAEEATTE